MVSHLTTVVLVAPTRSSIHWRTYHVRTNDCAQFGRPTLATQGIARGDSARGLHHRVRSSAREGVRVENTNVGRGEESPPAGYERRKPVRDRIGVLFWGASALREGSVNRDFAHKLVRLCVLVCLLYVVCCCKTHGHRVFHLVIMYQVSFLLRRVFASEGS